MSNSIATGNHPANDGGSVDIFFQEIFSSSSLGNFSNGNNASFLGGGALVGSFATELVNQISGSTSIKYTQASGSLNDYIASKLIDLDIKQRNNPLGINLYFTYDGNDSDIEVVVYDVTNSKVLTSATDLLTNESDATRFSTSFKPPINCTQIRYGFHVKVENIGAILIFDEVEMSSNPFIYKQLVDDEISARINGNGTLTTLSSSAQKMSLGSANFDIHSMIDSINNKIIIPKDGKYKLRFEVETQADVSVKRFNLMYYINGGNQKNTYFTTQTQLAGNGISQLLSLSENDYIEIYISSGSSTVNVELDALSIFKITKTTEHIVTPTSQVASVRYSHTTGQSVPTSVFTPIDFNVVEYDDNFTYTAGIGYNSALGTWTTDPSFKIIKDGKYKIAGRLVTSGRNVNSASRTLFQININGIQKLILDLDHGGEPGSYTLFAMDGSTTLDLKKDDYITIIYQHTVGIASVLNTSSTNCYITIDPVAPSSLLSAIPTNYQNVNENLLTNGSSIISERPISYTSATAISQSDVGLDRWRIYAAGENGLTLQELDPAERVGKTQKLVHTGVSYSGVMGWYQRFGANSRNLLKGQTLTASCWVKSDHASARLGPWDGTLVHSNDTTAKHSGSGQWEFLYLTFTLPVGATNLDYIPRIMGITGGNVTINGESIEIGEMKLERGDKATTFIPRVAEDELLLCQRFYEVVRFPANTASSQMFRAFSTTAAQGTLKWNVTKDNTPTITAANLVFTNLSKGDLTAATVTANVWSVISLISARWNIAASPLVNGSHVMGFGIGASEGQIFIDSEL